MRNKFADVCPYYVMMTIVLGLIIWGSSRSGKPVLNVVIYEQSPKKLLGPVNILPEEKSEKIYQYLFRSANPDGFDARDYLIRYPEDGVVISYTGDGGHALLVFSDNLPDPAFFRVKKQPVLPKKEIAVEEKIVVKGFLATRRCKGVTEEIITPGEITPKK